MFRLWVSLAVGPPLVTSILRDQKFVKDFDTKHKQGYVEEDQQFSIHAVLGLSSSISPPIFPSTSKQKPRQPICSHLQRVIEI